VTDNRWELAVVTLVAIAVVCEQGGQARLEYRMLRVKGAGHGAAPSTGVPLHLKQMITAGSPDDG
jgi:hypothetical protein